jgi:hypothetical protein
MLALDKEVEVSTINHPAGRYLGHVERDCEVLKDA